MIRRVSPGPCFLFFLVLSLFAAPTLAGAEEPSAASPAAPSPSVLSGQVLDQASLIPIEGIEVVIEGADFSTKTDAEGRFRFPDLPPGEKKVVFQSTKYERLVKEIKLAPGENELSVDLKAAKSAVELAEVSVTARRETVAISKQTLQKEEIETVPGAATDPIRVVQSMPGVANIGVAALGTPGLVIRGSGPQDSRYYLEGFDIPQLFHFGGLLTVVNSEWLESIDYYAGGYSVKYGGATGGIVELKTRLPNNQKFSGVADLTNYASFAMVEGPIAGGGKFSGGLSARRSFIDFILPEFISEDEAKLTLMPRFYDFQAAAVYQSSPVNSIRMFAFGSDDKAGLISVQTDEYLPTATQSFEFEAWFYRPILSWVCTPSSDINNRLAAAPDFQKFRTLLFGDKFVELSGTAIEVRDDLSIKLADWNTLGVGAEFAYVAARARMNIIRPPKEGHPSGIELFNQKSYLFDETLDGYYTEGYIEDSFKIGRYLSITPGVHGSTVAFVTKSQTGNEYYFDPRIFTRIYVTDKATLKAAAGVYHQYPAPDELLEPFGTLDLVPVVSNSYGGGVEYDFPAGVRLDVQGYYKELYNMVSPTPPDAEKPYNNEGIGRIYGAEILLRKDLTKRLYGWISYTYGVSRRRDQTGDDWRYFDQDQRHNFIVLGSYKIGDTWRAGARFAYATGLPYTDIDTAVYNADADSFIPVYSDKINAKRDPPLHQIDVRVDKEWPFKSWILKIYLDVQNAYFHKQPVGYFYNYDYTKRLAVGFPTFYPTLGIQARW